MQGLSGMARNNSSIKASGLEINILDELGLNREEAVFKSRTQALTDPKTYASDRDKMFTMLKTEVANAYEKTKADLEHSGLSLMEVQKLAIDAASNTRRTLGAMMETRFPSGSTELNIQTNAKNAFEGMVGAPTAPAAPRRRAAPRKKAAAPQIVVVAAPAAAPAVKARKPRAKKKA